MYFGAEKGTENWNWQRNPASDLLSSGGHFSQAGRLCHIGKGTENGIGSTYIVRPLEVRIWRDALPRVRASGRVPPKGIYCLSLNGWFNPKRPRFDRIGGPGPARRRWCRGLRRL